MRDPIFLRNPHSPNVPRVRGKPLSMGPNYVLGCHDIHELTKVVILREGWKLLTRVLLEEG
jgi:hypothetical protein